MSLRPPRTCAAALSLAALVLGVAGCGTGDSEAESQGFTTPTSPSPSATASASQTPEEAAIAAARKVIPLYYRASDQAASDPAAFNPDDFKKVAISTGLTELTNELAAYRAQAIRAVGSGTVVSMDNPRVDLKNNPKVTPPDIPTVQMDVCYDVSKVDVVDRGGKSVIPADRAPRVLKLVGVSNYSYPKADEWKVSYTRTQKDKKC